MLPVHRTDLISLRNGGVENCELIEATIVIGLYWLDIVLDNHYRPGLLNFVADCWVEPNEVNLASLRGLCLALVCLRRLFFQRKPFRGRGQVPLSIG